MINLKIYDTTLRDGEQAPGCSMSVGEKLEVARALEKLGADIIEAGFAIASAGDTKAISEISKSIKSAGVASLARAKKEDIDAAFEALKKAQYARVNIVLATSPIHMKYKLKMSEDEILSLAKETVSYAKKYFDDVQFTCEDATRSNPDFLIKVIKCVTKNGVKTICIPDTVGYCVGNETNELFSYIKNNCDISNEIVYAAHCHNDLGLAVSNSLGAIKGGAEQLECTVNGIGERAGNTSLEEVIMALYTRNELYNVKTNINTKQIYRTSRIVYNAIGQNAPLNKPIVGKNAFSHEAGIHQHGYMSNPQTYEIISPQIIGKNSDEIVLGKHSGRHAVEQRLYELGYELSREELEECFKSFKDLCDKKKYVNDSDLEAIAGHLMKQSDLSGYKLIRFDVHAGNKTTSTGTIKLKYSDEFFEDVSLGDGPIDSSFNAIDKIIKPPKHTFEIYTVNSVSEGKDTLAEAVVGIKSGDILFTGRGLSTDAIEASITAYLNAVNKLIKVKEDR